MAVHILELTKFGKPVEQLTTPLDRWLFFLNNATELDADALPEPLDVPEIRRAMGDLLMISQSERDRERYESRLTMQRDVSTALAEKREEGREEGRAKGRAEERRAYVQSLQELLGQNSMSLEQLRALSLPELESLGARLRAELKSKLANGS